MVAALFFSESEGVLELVVEMGDSVKAGDLVGRVHDIKRTGTMPTDYYSQIDGIVTGRHFPGKIAMGDFLAVIAVAV
jgi:N-alpha-acetyl-L-2,4-diaminobutyrate deacetylase